MTSKWETSPTEVTSCSKIHSDLSSLPRTRWAFVSIGRLRAKDHNHNRPIACEDLINLCDRSRCHGSRNSSRLQKDRGDVASCGPTLSRKETFGTQPGWPLSVCQGGNCARNESHLCPLRNPPLRSRTPAMLIHFRGQGTCFIGRSPLYEAHLTAILRINSVF